MRLSAPFLGNEWSIGGMEYWSIGVLEGWHGVWSPGFSGRVLSLEGGGKGLLSPALSSRGGEGEAPAHRLGDVLVPCRFRKFPRIPLGLQVREAASRSNPKVEGRISKRARHWISDFRFVMWNVATSQFVSAKAIRVPGMISIVHL